MIRYSDYHGPQGAYAAIDGKLVPLAQAASILADNAMKLASFSGTKLSNCTIVRKPDV